MPDDITSRNNAKTWFTEGLILAAASISAYLIAFAYEGAYAEYFHIPYTVIEFDFVTVVIALLTVIFTTMFFYNLAETIYPIWVTLPNAIKAILILSSPFIFLFIVLFILIDVELSDLTPLYIMFAGIVLPYLLSPLFTIRQHGGYIKALDAYIERNHKNGGGYKSVYDKIMTSSPRIGWAIAIFYAFLAILLTAHGVGHRNAKRETYYQVVVSNPEEVILRAYPHKIITSTFDRQTHQLGGVLNIINLDSIPRLSLRYERIGPLKLADTDRISVVSESSSTKLPPTKVIEQPDN